jgi:hypothetical protein
MSRTRRRRRRGESRRGRRRRGRRGRKRRRRGRGGRRRRRGFPFSRVEVGQKGRV